MERPVVLVLIMHALGAMPAWGYHRGWGYGPSPALSMVVVVMLFVAALAGV